MFDLAAIHGRQRWHKRVRSDNRVRSQSRPSGVRGLS
jgi:hypothetical protein